MSLSSRKRLTVVTRAITVMAMFVAPHASMAADPRPALPPAPEPAAVDSTRVNYGDISIHLDRQHEYTCRTADAVLRANRPTCESNPARKAALFALDEALHYKDPDAGHSPAVLDFLKKRLELAAYEMERTKVTEGAVIWKLYDHAFVVRTASVTFAFDLTRGSGIWWPDDQLQKTAKLIVGQCDALFVSHEHGDHLDPFVVGSFQAQGKPVILPGSLARDGTTQHLVQLSNNRELRIVMLAGYQGNLINNVPIVYTPEGMSFAHTGDLFQSNSTPVNQFDWIDRVKDKWNVDVLMINVWAPKPQQVVAGFAPRLVIPGHENELTHGIDDRKPFWMSFERFQGMEYPYVVMAWGESYYYLRSATE